MTTRPPAVELARVDRLLEVAVRRRARHTRAGSTTAAAAWSARIDRLLDARLDLVAELRAN